MQRLWVDYIGTPHKERSITADSQETTTLSHHPPNWFCYKTVIGPTIHTGQHTIGSSPLVFCLSKSISEAHAKPC